MKVSDKLSIVYSRLVYRICSTLQICGFQTFLHVDPQLKYTIYCRPRRLIQQLLIQD